MTLTRTVLIALLGSLLLLPGCGGEERAAAADPATRAWVDAYGKQLDRWAEGAAQMSAAIRQRAWGRLGRVVKRMGRDGDSVRDRFAAVPPALAGADDLYALLLDAGDAASAWARRVPARPAAVPRQRRREGQVAGPRRRGGRLPGQGQPRRRRAAVAPRGLVRTVSAAPAAGLVAELALVGVGVDLIEGVDSHGKSFA